MNLSTEQQSILDADENCILIDGCAGSGKSELLIALVKNLLHHYDSTDILVASFGKRDSQKFTERLEQAGLSSIQAVTVHSHCYGIVWNDVRKQVAEGKESAKRFLSEVGTLKLVQGRAKSELIDKAMQTSMNIPDAPPIDDKIDYAGDIDRFKSVGIRTKSMSAKYDARFMVYLQYQRLLDMQGSVDFGDLQLKAEDVMKDCIDKQYKAIILDEIQDLSPQQLRILGLLLPKAEKVIVAFDAAQAIYGFRGAVGRNIEYQMKQLLPDFVTMKLQCNHRSAISIVNHAEALFKRGMTATRPEQGEVVHEKQVYGDPTKHANDLLETVKRWRDSMSYKDMAILCRTRNAMPMIEATFYAANIPVVKGIKPFTELPEIQDLVAWLQMADYRMMLRKPYRNHPFWRIYKTPKRHFLGKEWEKLARKQPGLLEDVLRPSLYPPKYRDELQRLLQSLRYIQDLTNPLDILFYVVNVMSPSYREYQGKFAPETLGNPMDNINNLVRLAQGYKTVGELLELLKAVDKVSKTDAVELTTVHQAKGREWKGIVGVNTIGKYLNHADLAEEQRVNYVMKTRPTDCFFETTVMV